MGKESKKTKSSKVNYPFLPKGRNFKYVGQGNKFMKAARDYARKYSQDDAVPTGSVIVKAGEIVGRGANGSDYHKTHVCKRVELGIPTGQGYELCEGCHPKNHSEPRAILDGLSRHKDIRGADLYLWGHWWACEPCWLAIQDAGIKDIYLLENSQVLFNREHSDNVLGQFASA